MTSDRFLENRKAFDLGLLWVKSGLGVLVSVSTDLLCVCVIRVAVSTTTLTWLRERRRTCWMHREGHGCIFQCVTSVAFDVRATLTWSKVFFLQRKDTFSDNRVRALFCKRNKLF